MDIEQVAALCAVLGFTFKALQILWKHLRGPVMKLIICLLDNLTNFLTWVKEILLKRK